MEQTILFLLVDGLTSGAIYALVALCLVLVYSVTRVLNIAQGEFVTLGALTVVSLLGGRMPPTVYLLVAGLLVWGGVDAWQARHQPRRVALVLAATAAACSAAWGLAAAAVALRLPLIGQMLVTLALVSALGPITYRLVIQPVPNAGILVYVILTVGIYLALHGLELLFWGPAPYPMPPFSSGGLNLGRVFVTAQSLWVFATAIVLMVAFYLFFGRTMYGKALRASAVNRLGAQLNGIPVVRAGMLSFLLSAGVGAMSGMLIAPLITANYEMGFPVGLKGFVGAVLGGLVNYPLAVGGAILVGLLESVSAYALSAYRDALVYSLIIPILLWRNRKRLSGPQQSEAE